MNRRIFLMSSFAAPLVARAEGQPWQARVIKGHFDGTAWHAGLQVMLLPGWKTYWRVPGASGIAPSIDVTGENLKSADILFPTPQRLKAGEDDVIGYMDEVVFPVLLQPQDPAKTLSVAVKTFLGVCDLVCIPVQYEGMAEFKPTGVASADDPTLSAWIAKLPKPTIGVVAAATATMENGKPAVRLVLSQTVKDIFAEGKATHYFHAPQFSGADAVLAISGAKSIDELKGQAIRLTMTTSQGGVEQTVTIV